MGFKKFGLPVDRTTSFGYAVIKELVLEPYFKPIPDLNRYYSPFRTSDPSNRWISGRYESTSLQRIVADTFGDAFIHEKGEGRWGWKKDYIAQLKRLLNRHSVPMPLGHLGVWLYRDARWSRDTTLRDVRARVVEEFRLSNRELSELSVPAHQEQPDKLRLDDDAIELADLLNIIGDPRPGKAQTISGVQAVRLSGTGPAASMDYLAARRTNVVTGDNSLGKTFLLDSIWWALTGEWVDFPALPNDLAGSASPTIEASFTTRGKRESLLKAYFNPSQRTWMRPNNSPMLEGVGLYVLSDGRFAVWDSERIGSGDLGRSTERRPYMLLTHSNALHGLEADPLGRSRQFICNGLIQDIVVWELNAESYSARTSSFNAALKGLSPIEAAELANNPASVNLLRLGKPVRVPGDSRDIPTLKMPYGLVPVLHASAGVQRILTIAYLMVWAWHEHLTRLRELGRKDRPNFVILVDEIEAHLHPKWQRVILPSLMKVAAEISSGGDIQFHIATHSPIVMTSIEAILDDSNDRLHHLKLDESGEVTLQELGLTRRGSVNDWLESPVFDGQVPWAPEAAAAKNAAVEIMNEPNPSGSDVQRIHSELVQNLPSIHPFWPRWKSFARAFIPDDEL